MKYFTIIFCAFCTSSISAQTITESAGPPIVIEEPAAPDISVLNSLHGDDVISYDTAPQFRNGKIDLSNYLKAHYKPASRNLKGKVYVTFVVAADGSVTDIQIVRDLGGDTGTEAIRVLKEMPRWKPAMAKGQPISATVMLPINMQNL